MPSFEDHFSKHARDYSRYRPQYPGELYAYLASISPRRRLAWDCGTGNGQAAVGLARHFDRVVATDASADQLAHALPHPRIEYRVEPAEDTRLETGSVDLVTVAVAVHWFDLERFYATVRRVLVAGGAIAVWTYLDSAIEPAVDRVVRRYYAEVLDGYWPERFRYIAERYRTLPFPFDELAPPAFDVRATWNLDQLVGFMSSWSGTQRYRHERGEHPVEVIWPALAEAWGDPDRARLVRWPLHLRVGRAAAAGTHRS